MTSDMQHHAPVSKVGFDAAIINDGLVVGFMRGDKAYLPYHVVDSSYESDNNGAGYKESTTRYYLVVLRVHRARYVTFRCLVRLSIRSQSRSLRGTERSICRKSF